VRKNDAYEYAILKIKTPTIRGHRKEALNEPYREDVYMNAKPVQVVAA
jgi:hypothetical protein